MRRSKPIENSAAVLSAQRRLYEAAMRVKEMAPWTWLQETDVFGVQLPDGELGFISVMGAMGEHYGVSVYRGWTSLKQFLTFAAGHEHDADALRLLEIAQLQVSFEDADVLEVADRKDIKALGLKFRGRNAWPMFRSYLPAHVPWFMEPAEMPLLTHALEQLCEMAPRIRTDSRMLWPAPQNMLVMTGEETSGGIVWHERSVPVPPDTVINVRIDIDTDLVDRVHHLPRRPMRLEVDFFMLPTAVMEGSRPYFPYALLLVDATQGMVLSIKLLSPLPSLPDMWQRIPEQFLLALVEIGAYPAAVAASKSPPLGLLAALVKYLHIPFKHGRGLKRLPAAKASLLAHI